MAASDDWYKPKNLNLWRIYSKLSVYRHVSSMQAVSNFGITLRNIHYIYEFQSTFTFKKVSYHQTMN
jgi:hypothetical protein